MVFSRGRGRLFERERLLTKRHSKGGARYKGGRRALNRINRENSKHLMMQNFLYPVVVIRVGFD